MNSANTNNPQTTSQESEKAKETLLKEKLIERLLNKAELDYKCCGHGGHSSPEERQPS